MFPAIFIADGLSYRKVVLLQCTKTFTFLNLIGDFKSWNDVSHGMLWAYNLNYMDWLLQPDMTFEQGSEWLNGL